MNFTGLHILHEKGNLDVSTFPVKSVSKFRFFHRIFQRFRELDPKHIPLIMTGDESHTLSIPMEKIERMQELRVTPMNISFID